MSSKNKFSCEHLLILLGQQVVYQQQQCEIIELLDGCELVLQVLEDDTNIQATQYGEGHRAVPVTYVLPVFDGEGDLHADLIAAGLEKLLKTYLK
ncbi:MAG: hypothetical protein DRQ39_00810 [Gammaproteobacteria bacterium]|nr:MAG: hypothetical protein DRQ39_00810 [Gammaproteobacteria bacterium]RKZ96389.1 MAG: hypothetical protein DRQ40_01105 [Gammaproteobacteria bacterium]RKZ98895.1 MAG: hypothetical protein DRQ46_00820 [Gammaproteobacteria bacterium]RLA00915.1 MAG: hypothetical protein DRQ42_04435 [Gammaproteobacteria bacterium]